MFPKFPPTTKIYLIKCDGNLTYVFYVLGVDVLHHLGLTDKSTTVYHDERGRSLPKHTTVPPALNPPVSGYGVLLDSNSLYEAAAGSLFPPEISEEFSFVVSLSSWRANNAFLFSVKDGRDRLRFGIQLLPHRVVVYTAEKASIYFTYHWQDGRQHTFAIGVRAHSVSFYANCGTVQQREQTLGRSQILGDSGGLFTLGKMNSKAAAFNGRVCQLDFYPSAQAAAHYCKYLKKQCRLADTFRSHSTHAGLDTEVNDPSSNPLTTSLVGVAATHNTFTKPTTATGQYASTSTRPRTAVETHNSTLVPLGHSLYTSSIRPHSPTSSNPSTQNMMDPTHSTAIVTTKNTLTKRTKFQADADQPENSAEKQLSFGSPLTPHATPVTLLPFRKNKLKEGIRNNSITNSPKKKQAQTHQLLDTQPKANSTTLYRQSHVDNSEQHYPDGSYDDIDTGEYDYGYEEPDFFYDYEDGLRGAKGEPGPPVSNSIVY